MSVLIAVSHRFRINFVCRGCFTSFPSSFGPFEMLPQPLISIVDGMMLMKNGERRGKDLWGREGADRQCMRCSIKSAPFLWILLRFHLSQTFQSREHCPKDVSRWKEKIGGRQCCPAGEERAVLEDSHDSLESPVSPVSSSG